MILFLFAQEAFQKKQFHTGSERLFGAGTQWEDIHRHFLKEMCSFVTGSF